jgi:hypothetical protein
MDPLSLAYRARLQAPTRHTFDLHLDAAARADWLAAGVWGAVFLEAFLEEAMRARGMSLPDRVDLGGAIARLRGEKNLPNGRVLIERCEQIRYARNALVHSGPMAGQATDAHARTISACLGEVIQLAEAWFAGIAPPEPAAAFSMPDPIARIFISAANPHLPRQQSFLRDLHLALRGRALEPVVVEMDEYDRRDPMAKVVGVLRSCDALLCVGLERSHAFLLRHREGSKRQSETTHGFFSSGWLNMEAGAAFALGKPVQVLCEDRIMSEGIFDRDWNSSPPFLMKGEYPSVEDPAVHACLTRLEERVREGLARPTRTATRANPASARRRQPTQ